MTRRPTDSRLRSPLATTGGGLALAAAGIILTEAAQPDVPRVAGYLASVLAGLLGAAAVALWRRNAFLAAENRRLLAGERARRETEAALHESEGRYRSLSEAVFAGVALHEDGRILEANANLAAMFGYAPEELRGLEVGELVRTNEARGVPDPIASDPPHTVEVEGLRKDGSTFPCEVSGREVPYRGRRVRLLAVRDITARRKLQRALTTMAFLDDLTGLYNRRGFMTVADQQLRAAARRGTGAALFYMDLDNLKAVNDRWGHLTGDEALADTADVLKGTFRKSDVVARVGGDEFAVLAVDCEREAVERIRRHLEHNIAAYNAGTSRPFRLALSVGSAYFSPDSPADIRNLLKQADEAMYEEKRRRKLEQLDHEARRGATPPPEPDRRTP